MSPVLRTVLLLLALASPAFAQTGDVTVRTLLTPSGGSVGRTLAGKLGDVLSLLDFGAKCDGVTNDSAAVQAAGATGKWIAIPSGLVCNAPGVLYPPPGLFAGPGVIKTADGYTRAPVSIDVTGPTTPHVNVGGITTAFNGSLYGLIGTEKTISGATTLQPPSGGGYALYPEQSMFLDVMTNQTGGNGTLFDNSARTGLAMRYERVNQYGGGDFGAFFCDGWISSPVAGQASYPNITNYLAAPAIGCFGGQIFANTAGGYLQGFGDLDFNDRGFDVAVAGTVLNFNRTNASEAIGANWVADIRQSGPLPIDAAYRMNGPTVAGIDFSNAGLTWFRLGVLYLPNGGSGYKVGDVLTVTGGAAITPTTLKVSTIGTGGVITGLTVTNAGIYTTPPVTQVTTLPYSGGSGTGAVMSGGYASGDALILPPSGGCTSVAANAGGGGANQVQDGTSSTVCLTPGAVSLGDRLNPSLTVNGSGAGYGTLTRGHSYHTQFAAPTVACTGAGGVAVAGSTVEAGSTDNAGSVDIVGAATACTLTFAASWQNAPATHPFCVFTPSGAAVPIIEEGRSATITVFARSDFAVMTNSVNYACN